MANDGNDISGTGRVPTTAGGADGGAYGGADGGAYGGADGGADGAGCGDVYESCCEGGLIYDCGTAGGGDS
tara:strand:- start:190 stop:402 length:213 start_codon:yes stop_codon:yes gene_type:complete